MQHWRVLTSAAILAVALVLAASCPKDAETVYPEVLGGSPVVQAAETDPAKIMVYVTKSGEKYHLDGCKYLAKSRSAAPPLRIAGRDARATSDPRH